MKKKCKLLINKDKNIYLFLKLIALNADSNCMPDINMDNNAIRDEPKDDNEVEMDESSAVDNEHMHHRTEKSVPDTNGTVDEGETDISDSPEEEYADLNQPYTVDRRKDKRDDRNRRRHERNEFIYPLELKIFSPLLTNISFNGYIEDISASGAGIKFEDRYGRVLIDGLGGAGIKLIIRMPHGDDIALLSTIRWIKRDINQKMIVKVGIEFQTLDDWQLHAVKQLIGLKNKDQNMMWNLFENYEKNIR